MSQQRDHKRSNKIFKLNGNFKKYIKTKNFCSSKEHQENKKLRENKEVRDLKENMHSTKDLHQKCKKRASLVAQWLRIHLPMQGTRV